MLAENLWKRKISYIREHFESFFQVKIYFFLHEQSSRVTNILREAFYDEALFIKNQINESDYNI